MDANEGSLPAFSLPLAQQLLSEVFGHTEFRGLQKDVIGEISVGKHALVIMPTGMGKSVCYQIPALAIARQRAQPNPLTLILSPLIALMKDQVLSLIHI